MCQKSLIIIGNNQFWVFEFNFIYFSNKKGKKNTFQDLKFSPADDKNAIETCFSGQFEPLKEIDILEK